MRLPRRAGYPVAHRATGRDRRSGKSNRNARLNSAEAVDLVRGWRSERHRGRLSWRLRRFNYGEG